MCLTPAVRVSRGSMSQRGILNEGGGATERGSTSHEQLTRISQGRFLPTPGMRPLVYVTPGNVFIDEFSIRVSV